MAAALDLLARALDEAPSELDFAGMMARFAPFERKPHLAVAVSGGSDSLALMLLADAWARARGGKLTALTVDHGLRPEAATEAAQVAAWCAARGTEHVILRRVGPTLRSGIQASARVARYALLEAWCREHGVLHLLLGHQCEDQAETVKMRAARGSGLDGLAGMACISERGAVRLLRPLLAVSRAQLRRYLAACGQAWIEDPSNRNPAFTRVRVRDALDHAAPGSSDANLAITAARLGRQRALREADEAWHLAAAVALHPAGFAWVDPDAFARGAALGSSALAALLTTVAGGDYPPRSERVERLRQALADGLGEGRTLGGCLVLPRRGKILVCREPAAVAAPVPVLPGADTGWDGRFRLRLDFAAPAGLWLGALGCDSAAVAREAPKAAVAAIPPAARATLPALRDAKGVVAVPALGYFNRCSQEAMTAARRVRFRPIRPLTGAGFTIV